MGLDFELITGQTPLEGEEIAGLLVASITSRKELDEFEQLNIEHAIQWTLSARISRKSILTEKFIKKVHHEMFKLVWRWAGVFRTSEKNIRVPHYKIQVELKALLDDCSYWILHNTSLPDEIAVRFKHRLVSIHCFANGNGRHSRLMADLIMMKLFNKPPFTWKGPRENYIKAVKAGDLNDLSLLLNFARN